MSYINDSEQCHHRSDIFQWMCLYKAPFPLTYTYISIILVPSFPSPVVDPILHASSCFVSIIRQTDAPLWKGRSLSDIHCVTTESVLHRDPNISAHNLHLFVSGVVQILVEFHSPQLVFCQNPNKILSSKDRLSFFLFTGDLRE